MSADQLLLPLLTSLYEATIDAEQWPTFLKLLAEALRADAVALFGLDPQPALFYPVPQVGFDSNHLVRFINEFNNNIWVQRANARHGPDEVRYSQGLASLHELRHTRYYEDFLRPADVGQSAGLRISYGGGGLAYLAAARSWRGEEFQETEGDLLLTLQPHIRRALELHHRSNGYLMSLELLDALPYGVAFVSSALVPLHYNRYFADVLADRDGFLIDRSGISTYLDTDRRQLQSLLQQATGRTDPPNPLAGGGALSVSRPSLRQAYRVLVTPIRGASLGAKSAAAAILVTDPERQEEESPERLARYFGFTSAEARLAALLMRGETVERAAEQLGIRQTTVRTHLRHLLLKTGTSRQHELVRALLERPALKRPLPDSRKR